MTPPDVMSAEEAQAWRDDGVDGNRDEIARLCDTIIALHQRAADAWAAGAQAARAADVVACERYAEVWRAFNAGLRQTPEDTAASALAAERLAALDGLGSSRRGAEVDGVGRVRGDSSPTRAPHPSPRCANASRRRRRPPPPSSTSAGPTWGASSPVSRGYSTPST